MVAHARRVADAVTIPVLADAEQRRQFWRTVRAFEQAGVCGIHIEDHEFGKHADVPQVLLSTREMVQKIRAAVDGREDENFLIIARTDAAWAFGDVEDAIARINAFTAAGRSCRAGRHRAEEAEGPARAHSRRGGWVDVVLYYGMSPYAAYAGVTAALDAIKRTRDAEAAHLRGDITEFEHFIGYPGFSARGGKYGLA
jgi:methylisocitrate lyase